MSAFIFPSTRYQGSKAKIVEWIDQSTQHLSFDTVLDAFGGTGCVSYMFKKNGKRVLYNDLLKFNHHIGLALIENSKIYLEEKDIDFIVKKHEKNNYPTFIFDIFHDIYFTDEENEWLDTVVTNIKGIKNEYKKSIALYALFQSCIIKRPFNLFHRKNLYIRTAEMERKFGNKKTWDTPFENHFRKFVHEANNAIFDNGRDNKAHNFDVFELDVKVDLVYIDTPYISTKGNGVSYLDFYHFLEGITEYDNWAEKIDTKSKHKKLKNNSKSWTNKKTIHEEFDRLFEKFKDSILVISYRDDGIPTIDEMTKMLKKYKKNIDVKTMDYKYVLSKQKTKEVLFIAG